MFWTMFKACQHAGKIPIHSNIYQLASKHPYLTLPIVCCLSLKGHAQFTSRLKPNRQFWSNILTRILEWLTAHDTSKPFLSVKVTMRSGGGNGYPLPKLHCWRGPSFCSNRLWNLKQYLFLNTYF